MSYQLYITRLKCLLRNKQAIFWSYLFPLLLATCFYFTLNNLWKIEAFETISIGYQEMPNDSVDFTKLLSEAKVNDQTPMFDIIYCDEEEAAKLFLENKIDAFIIGGTKPELVIKSNGFNQTIVKAFIDNYYRMSSVISTVLSENPNAISEGLLDDVMQIDTFVEEKMNGKKPNQASIYFHALFAMTCLFATNWGLDEVVNIQANLSARGARVSVSPVNKMKLYFYNLLAAFTGHMIGVVLLFLYIIFILRMDFGNNLFFIFGICIIGSLTGLFLGCTVGVWLKMKTEAKEAILTTIVMLGSFLSGMMYADIKYIIAKNVPILSYINPVNLVADSMYSVYFYDTYEKFYLNATILSIMSVLLCIASYLGVRRKSYASI